LSQLWNLIREQIKIEGSTELKSGLLSKMYKYSECSIKLEEKKQRELLKLLEVTEDRSASNEGYKWRNFSYLIQTVTSQTDHLLIFNQFMACCVFFNQVNWFFNVPDHLWV
jgi:hypothetical protein